MRYLITGEDSDGTIHYEAREQEKRAGVFSYHVSAEHRFYVDEIRLSAGCESDRLFRAILNFLEYKAAVCGAGAVYVRINEKNHYAAKKFLENGFYSIDTETETDGAGRESRIAVLRNR